MGEKPGWAKLKWSAAEWITPGTVLAATAGTKPDPTGRLRFFNSVLSGQSYVMECIFSEAASMNWFKETMGGEHVFRVVMEGITTTFRDSFEPIAKEVGMKRVIILDERRGLRGSHTPSSRRGAVP